MCFELEKLEERNEKMEGGVGPQTTITTTPPENRTTIPDNETTIPDNETTTPAGGNCGKCGILECRPKVVTRETSKSAVSTLSRSANHPTPKSTLSRVHNQMKELVKHKELFRLPIYPKKLEVGFFVEMGGLEIDSPALDLPNATDGQATPPDTENAREPVTGRVTSSGALLLQKAGLLPRMDIARIKDKSKSDLLTKVLVCFQASWMVVQCIARKSTGLPISLLELTTVMHVMCALLTYGMWFKKPQDVGFPTIITPAEATKNLTCDQIKELEECIEPLEDKSRSLQLNTSTKSDIAEVSIFIGAILGLIASGVYGGVHLTVWYGHFPTRVERLLWRISGCIIVGMPVFLVLFMFLLKLVRGAAGLGTWEHRHQLPRTERLRELNNQDHPDVGF